MGMIQDSAKHGKMRIGKTQLLKYLSGRRLTRQEAIKAKCYDCDGMGETGECDMEECSLYPYSPYQR
jgi:hypothetical protein